MIDSKLDSNQEEEVEEGSNGVVFMGVLVGALVIMMTMVACVLPFHGSAPECKNSQKNHVEIA
ncbi:hypothetical protein [Marinicella litoralis]|uniref:hypothetical protein n=1 Tax=Marinicella litoralis TaxID=644220 RepID=UPI000BFEBE23|nr:hypothetical protein [Marinicella litoralis]